MKTPLIGAPIPSLPVPSSSVIIVDPDDEVPDDVTNLDEFITYVIDLVTTSVTGMVPYFVAATETFTVPIYKQALFNLPIDVEGTLDVDGYLLEVD